jgi:hypothetical protein
MISRVLSFFNGVSDESFVVLYNSEEELARALNENEIELTSSVKLSSLKPMGLEEFCNYAKGGK